MSWGPRFEVRLADPADRSAALRTARRLAGACRMRACRATTTDAAFAAAALAVCPGRAELTAESHEPFALPPPLLRDAAVSAKLAVTFEGARPALVLTLTRDAAGEPVTRLAMEGRATIAEPEWEACLALVRRTGMLAAPDAPAPPLELAPLSAQMEVPVYADAFPLLASELLGEGEAVYFQLEAAVSPEHAAALVAGAPPSASITLHLPPHDEAALAALDRAGAPDLSVTWDAPEPDLWIKIDHPRGGRVDDGRVYEVTLCWEPAPSLLVRTVIDHAELRYIEAWLAERAGAPVAYRPPQDDD